MPPSTSGTNWRNVPGPYSNNLLSSQERCMSLWPVPHHMHPLLFTLNLDPASSLCIPTSRSHTGAKGSPLTQQQELGVLATGCQLRLLRCGLPSPALLVPFKIDASISNTSACHLLLIFQQHPPCSPVIIICCVESHRHAIPCETVAPGETASVSSEMMPFSSCLLLKGERPITGCPTTNLSILITVFDRARESLWLIMSPYPPTLQKKQLGFTERAGRQSTHSQSVAELRLTHEPVNMARWGLIIAR